MARVGSWLRSLDYDRERQSGMSIASAWHQRPSIKVTEANYAFELTAYPRNSRKNADAPCLGVQSFGVQNSTSEGALKSSVASKASRYGNLETPYFVAVNVHDFALSEDSELGAFYGPLKFVVEQNPQTGEERNSRWEYNGSGCFFHNKKAINTRVSGVWVFKHLTPFGSGQRSSCLYYHPAAQFPMNLTVGAGVCRAHPDGVIEHQPGPPANSLLGLDNQWPEAAQESSEGVGEA